MSFTGNERVRLVDELSILIFFHLNWWNAKKTLPWGSAADSIWRTAEPLERVLVQVIFKLPYVPEAKSFHGNHWHVQWKLFWGKQRSSEPWNQFRFPSPQLHLPQHPLRQTCTLHDASFGFERLFIYHEDLRAFWHRPRKWYHILLLPFLLSHVFFLLNVLYLSLDTRFKCLLCNFPPNYIIIGYLPFRLAQPYPWEKDAHVLLYIRHTDWEVAPLYTSTSSTQIFLCKTNPFQVPLPGRFCDTWERLSFLTLTENEIPFQGFFSCACLYKRGLLALQKHSTHAPHCSGRTSYLAQSMASVEWILTLTGVNILHRV